MCKKKGRRKDIWIVISTMVQELQKINGEKKITLWNQWNINIDSFLHSHDSILHATTKFRNSLATGIKYNMVVWYYLTMAINYLTT